MFPGAAAFKVEPARCTAKKTEKAKYNDPKTKADGHKTYQISAAGTMPKSKIQRFPLFPVTLARRAAGPENPQGLLTLKFLSVITILH